MTNGVVGSKYSRRREAHRATGRASTVCRRRTLRRMCRGIFAKSSVIEARIIRKIVALMERGVSQSLPILTQQPHSAFARKILKLNEKAHSSCGAARFARGSPGRSGAL